MRLRLIAILPLLVGLSLAEPALADPPRAPAAAAAQQAPTFADRARAFAAKHNLPLREVQLPGQQGKRLFIPVTVATHDAFVREFSDTGAVVRQHAADKIHVPMVMGQNEVIGNYAAVTNNLQGVQGPAAGGLYLALDLSPAEKEHFRATFKEVQNNTPGSTSGCMTWLMHGCVAPNVPLAHKLGVRRSHTPDNWAKKLIHAGNDNILIGVPIAEPNQAQTQHARAQIAQYEAYAQQLEAQIGQLELQGGARLGVFQKQAEPYHEAMRQLDQTIAARQERQPAVAAGLRGKKAEFAHQLKALTEQHEAPFHARIQQLDASIAQKRAHVGQLEAARDAALKDLHNQVAHHEHEKDGTERQVAQNVKARQPGAHAAAYAAAVAGLDQQIGANQNQINAYQAQPVYARHVQQWQAAIQQLEQQKANLGNPHDYNPQYTARLTQVDQGLAQARATLAQHEANPAYAAHVPNQRIVVRQLEAAREVILKMGPVGYDAADEQRVTAATQHLVNARAQLEAQTTQHATGIAAARAQLANEEGMKANLTHFGALAYNPAYEQRLAQLDLAIAAQEANVHNPQYAQHRAHWTAEADKQRALKAELLAKGPAAYNPNEPQIAQLRQQVQQQKDAAAPLRQQVALADAAAAGDGEVARQFMAIPDQTLMGAPPGGEGRR
jgi:hypothetical protein